MALGFGLRGRAFAIIAITFFFTACDFTLGNLLGSDEVNASPIETPAIDPGNGGGAGGNAAIGPSCADESDVLCIGLKYVVYRDSSDAPLLQETDVVSNLATINQIWSQCQIRFQVDQFLAVSPGDYGLAFQTATYDEMDRIRRAFSDRQSFLIVTTGAWTGTLGAGSANAWTAMPGGGPFGIVLERSVGKYPNLIAHELGHYLNLSHVNDPADVMNALIYQNSTGLSSGQCAASRAAAGYYWKAMIR